MLPRPFFRNKPLGTIYYKDFTTATDLTDLIVNQGSGSIALSGGYLRCVNTAVRNDRTVFFKPNVGVFLGNQGTNLEYWEITLRFIARGNAADDYGIKVGLSSIAGNSAFDTFVFATCSSTPSIGIYRTIAPNLLVNVSASNNINVNDEIELFVKRDVKTLSVGYKNITTSTTLQSTQYTYPTTDTSSLMPNVSDMIFWFDGGVQDVLSLKIESSLASLKHCESVFVGDSITQHYCSTLNGNRWVNIALVANNSIGQRNSTVIAGQGQRSEDILRCIEEIKFLKPKRVYLMIGTNDILSTPQVAKSVFLANVASFIAALINIPVYVLSIPVLDDTTYSNWNADLATIYGNKFIDITPALLSSGSLDATKYISDRIHPNDLGNAAIGNLLRSLIPAQLHI